MTVPARPWNYARQEKRCVRCGAAFLVSPSRLNRTNHCSDECSRKTQALARTKPQGLKPCGVCGAPMSARTTTDRRRRFCGPACLARFRTGRPPGNKQPDRFLPCRVCGQEFRITERSRRIYCGRVCQAKAKRGKPAWNRQPKHPIACAWCREAVPLRKSRLATFRFCSRKCAAAYKSSVRGEQHPLWKPKVEVSCEWCGTRFNAQPSVAEERRFCSRRCVGSYSIALQNRRPSEPELIVESVLNILGERVERLAKIGQWQVDFYLPARRLIIECDGDYWHSRPTQVEKDRLRDTWLTAHGYNVRRISEGAIRRDARAVIVAALAA